MPSQTGSTSSRVTVPLGIVVVLLVAIGVYRWTYVPKPNPIGVQQFQLADSTHGVTCGPVTGDRRAGIPDSGASWTNWVIPEFQDRQRFIRRTDGKYGPITCIVAADTIEKFTAAAFSQPGGVLAAIVFVDGDPTGDVAYTNLKLTAPGYYCLYLHLNTASSSGLLRRVEFEGARPTAIAATSTTSGWDASVVQSVNGHCTPDMTSKLPGFRVLSAALSSADYPGVARFMHDTTGLPGLGVRCLEGWCVVGFSASAISRVVHSAGGGGGAERARRLVFGWYDQQQLAVPDPAGTSGLKPGLGASIRPHPLLETYRMATDFDQRFVEVAKIKLADRPTGKYRDIWQFENGRDNTLEIKHTPGGGREDWQVKVNGTINRKLKVRYTQHATGAFLASTARWVWKEQDEGVWVRCDLGCCEVEPEGTPWGIGL